MNATLMKPDPYTAKSRPLILSYWIMPLVAGLAVTLVASGMLIEVILLANRIDSNVTPIRVSTASIQTHAAGIAVLDKVDATAKSIRQAADPLSNQAATILTTVGSIQATVASIDTATGSIQTHTGTISSEVDSIAPHVRLIAEPVERIVADLKITNGDLQQAITIVSAVQGDLGSVAATPLLPTTNDHARSIDCHLGGVTASFGGPSTDCGNP